MAAVEGGDRLAAALQVIVLGAGGGPKEDNTTAFLVRSTASGWKRGSVLAVDAGVHLAAISNILETHEILPATGPNGKSILGDGPFKGLVLPHVSPKANAGYITRSLVETYLITHPHLDHICGFVVNTSALPASRPKCLAGLPSTIEAFKTHIFNNVIWPNLSDENNGAGLVTYMRLVEGGSPALGDGAGKGYVEVCEGLSVKTWGVSHGHCIEHHSHRGSEPTIDWYTQPDGPQVRKNSSTHAPPRSRSNSVRASDMGSIFRERVCVYDSSAYFIRDVVTGKEVLIFGDVEPDSISLSPRNKRVWQEAAPKVLSGQLGGIFIECSYDDSRSDDALFGHLKPSYLIQEMKVLANEIYLLKHHEENRKRKRQHNGSGVSHPPRKLVKTPPKFDLSPGSTRGSTRTLEEEVPEQEDDIKTTQSTTSILTNGNGNVEKVGLLKGVKVVVIHVKEKLDDGVDIGEVILKQLMDHDEKEGGLGCEFLISRKGQAVYM